MKKLTFLAFYKDYDTFLLELRDLGWVHVVQKDKAALVSEELEGFLARWKQLNDAQKLLEKIRNKKSDIPLNDPDVERGKVLPGQIEEIQNQRALLVQQLQVSKREYEVLKPWGNFYPEYLDLLEKEGYRIDFFVVSDNQYDPGWEAAYDAVVINREGAKTYFVTVTKGRRVSDELNIEQLRLPDVSLEQLQALMASLEDQISRQDRLLEQLSANLPSLKVAIKEQESKITLKKVILNTTSLADDKLMLLQGWAPADKVNEIVAYLESKDVYFEISDPLPEDDVPIQFKNNAFSRLFEPIAEMYMLPKYNEIDLTPYFAPFYMVFFGLALGDVGYGLFLFLVATLVKMLKKEALNRTLVSILSLVQVLGVSTMVCGLLTGGFFGFSLYDIDVPFVQDLKNKVVFDNNQMFTLSLILGVVQILFGMCLKVANRMKQLGFVHALSTIGWLILLLGVVFSYLFPVLMPLFGTAHLVVMIPALVLIFFFNSPGKNPLMNLGLGLWDTYNMATGLLGDVLSYVRLFALGLSGGILASVFNSLAIGMSPKNAIVGPVVTVLIFLIGHAINIFMNVLGSLVHPARLTFVEFYKNAEFEGGGRKYTPFRK